MNNSGVTNLPILNKEMSKTQRMATNSNLIVNKEQISSQNPFKMQLDKIVEIKIFLKQNFHKADIDDNFLADLDVEYAIQYLEKMGLLATKANINKLLKFKPIDKCDFSLTVEQIRNKSVKLLHIYPNQKSNSSQPFATNFKQAMSNDEFEKLMSKTSLQVKEGDDDKLTQIKKREIKKDEFYLYMPEIVENMFIKAREDIQDKKLYIQSHGMIEQHGKVFDLNIENIRNKYLKPTSQIILQNKDVSSMNTKAKFQNIDKAIKRDILTNGNYEYPYLDINLNKEILVEVNKPIEVPLEVIIKDINYILDNFPIDQLIHLDEPLRRTDNINTLQNNLNPLNKTAEESNYFNATGIYKNVESNYKKFSEQNQFYKIKSINKKDVLYTYKKIQSQPVYRIIGLLINLLYWIIFGFINRVQIDKFTKQHIYYKILEEIHHLETGFGNKKTFDKLFMPILILIIRIECEAIFHKKFKTFFEVKQNSEKALERINEIITVIFDPNCYFNTFTLLATDVSKLKHKMSKNMYPNYKSKINVTSNLVNQIFTKFTNENNVKKFMKEKNLENNPVMKDEDLELEKKYIMNLKVEFYKVLLNKINRNLKKRNLDPIFTVNKEQNKNILNSSMDNKK